MQFDPRRAGGRRYFAFPKIGHQNPWLDFLRSLAIMLVLLRHGVRAGPDVAPKGDGFVASLLINGWVGVDLFLVLSGYLIGNALIRRSQGGSVFPAMAGYFRARILRIVPAYYVAMLLIVGGAFPFYAVDYGGIVPRVFYHALFLQDYLPSDINVTFWSLGVEEKFYILAPLLVFAIAALPLRAVLGLLLALFLISPTLRLVAFAGQTEPVTYAHFFRAFRSPFHMVLEPLIMGVTVSYLTSLRGLAFTRRTAIVILCSALAGFALLAGSHDFMATISIYDIVFQPVVLALLFGAMVVAALSLHGVALPFEHFWRAVARLSYTLYLVHFPLIPLALHIAGRTPTSSAGAFWAAYICLSTAMAMALHFAVEKPFLMLKDRSIPKSAARSESRTFAIRQNTVAS